MENNLGNIESLKAYYTSPLYMKYFCDCLCCNSLNCSPNYVDLYEVDKTDDCLPGTCVKLFSKSCFAKSNSTQYAQVNAIWRDNNTVTRDIPTWAYGLVALSVFVLICTCVVRCRKKGLVSGSTQVAHQPIIANTNFGSTHPPMIANTTMTVGLGYTMQTGFSHGHDGNHHIGMMGPTLMFSQKPLLFQPMFQPGTPVPYQSSTLPPIPNVVYPSAPYPPGVPLAPYPPGVPIAPYPNHAPTLASYPDGTSPYQGPYLPQAPPQESYQEEGHLSQAYPEKTETVAAPTDCVSEPSNPPPYPLDENHQ